MTRSITFTRHQLNYLDKWPEMTMSQIGYQLGVSKSSVHRWLAMLGMIREWPSLDGPDTGLTRPRCTVCQIILEEAAKDDGPGVGTECRYCHALKQGINIYPRSAQPDGGDSWEHAIESYAMAAGRDNR